MKRNLVAFIGLRRSGKDSAAQALVQQGWQLVKFADPLKDMLRTYFRYVGVTTDHIEQMIEGGLKEEPNAQLCGKSTRWAMQSLGTEWGRKLIGDDLWVQAAMARAFQFPNVVISDCRFPNEAEAVRSQGGKLIRIERAGLVADTHPSEQLIATIPADFTIFNDSTLDDLRNKVLQLVNQ